MLVNKGNSGTETYFQRAGFEARYISGFGAGGWREKGEEDLGGGQHSGGEFCLAKKIF